jgi:hypothetical protein
MAGKAGIRVMTAKRRRHDDRVAAVFAIRNEARRKTTKWSEPLQHTHFAYDGRVGARKSPNHLQFLMIRDQDGHRVLATGQHAPQFEWTAE